MSDSVDICLLEDCGECIACHLRASQADVSRLSAEVDRLRAERDEQVRVNGFLVGRGKEQDIIRDRLSAEVAGLREQNARVIRDAHRDASELITLRADVRRLEGERDGLREALEVAKGWVLYGLEMASVLPSMPSVRAFIAGARAFLAPTPTGTRARAAAAADNQKAEPVVAATGDRTAPRPRCQCNFSRLSEPMHPQCPIHGVEARAAVAGVPEPDMGPPVAHASTWLCLLPSQACNQSRRCAAAEGCLAGVPEGKPAGEP